MDICDLSAVELSAALRRRELSAGEALDAVLRRADEIAGTVNPFSARLDERARRAAAAADALLARGESEAFYLRIHAPGDYRYPGADLGALVTRGRLQTDDNKLEDRCKAWITGLRSQFAGTPLAPQEPPPVGPLAFKMA